MTADPAFARRVIRLALTSLVALGIIWFMWAMTKRPPAIIGISLAAGWVLMPTVLGLSLRWPVIRYAVIAPASLVGLALLGICLRYAPTAPAARLGWMMITAGVLFGGVLGAWFWLRWLPVPVRLHDPFSTGRWALIAVHVALIVAGMSLVGVSALLPTGRG